MRDVDGDDFGLAWLVVERHKLARSCGCRGILGLLFNFLFGGKVNCHVTIPVAIQVQDLSKGKVIPNDVAGGKAVSCKVLGMEHIEAC